MYAFISLFFSSESKSACLATVSISRTTWFLRLTYLFASLSTAKAFPSHFSLGTYLRLLWAKQKHGLLYQDHKYLTMSDISGNQGPESKGLRSFSQFVFRWDLNTMASTLSFLSLLQIKTNFPETNGVYATKSILSEWEIASTAFPN